MEVLKSSKLQLKSPYLDLKKYIIIYFFLDNYKNYCIK
jgi:hypothetical protein